MDAPGFNARATRLPHEIRARQTRGYGDQGPECRQGGGGDGMTLCAKLAAYFRQFPNHWIDGRALAHVAGSYAWRTRVSDLRKPPFNMAIENRQVKRRSGDETFVVSEYRYVPADEQRVAS